MQIIENMNELVFESISLQKYNKFGNYIKSPYIKNLKCEDGILIYNALTSEIILVSEKEHDNPDAELYKWMIKHWYYLPEGESPKSIVYMLKHQMDIVSPQQPLPLANRCVIATTSFCNARCTYCYEAGVVGRNMTNEKALEVAKYIKDNCSKYSRITWFGGEPLCNPHAIRIISGYLKEHGIKYDSSVITNGYLIDQFSAEEMKNDWGVQSFQITLDGTKDAYLATKNYKNEDPNAFEKVLNNIDYILKNGFRVSIRLNVSTDNGNDLLDLVDILYERFSKYKKISIYPRELFVGLGDPPLELTDEEYNIVTDSVIKLTDKIMSLNMMGKVVDITTPKRTHCMADRGTCPMITPEGNLTPCEHYLDSEICGNIFSGITDHVLLDSWTEPKRRHSICDDCLFYPKCIKIKKCPGSSICNEAEQRLLYYRIDTRMKLMYRNYKRITSALNK